MALYEYDIEYQGYIYTIEGPEDAREEDLFAAVRSHVASEPPEEVEPEEKDTSWLDRITSGNFFGNEAIATGQAQDGSEAGEIEMAAQGADPDELRETTRGIAGASTAGLAGAAGGVVDMLGTAADVVNPFGRSSGSAREFVRPFVEEMTDIRQLELQAAEDYRPEGAVAGTLYDATGAALGMAPMIMASLITKNPTIALSAMGTKVAGETWSDAKAKGWDDLDAAGEVVKQVAYEVGPEKLFGVFQRMGGLNAVRDFVELAVAEAGSEGVTELLNIVEEGINEEDSIPDFFERLHSKENADRINYSMLLGGILGLTLGGPGAAQTYAMKQSAMNREEDIKTSEYVLESIRQRAEEEKSEIKRGKEETLRKREAARQRAREAIDEAIGRRRDTTDFEYEGTAGTTGVGYIPSIEPDAIEGLETQFDAPPVVEPVGPNAPTQAEIELLGRQRDPRELRDPQNVPPVGQAMLEDALNLEQYTPSELADFARQRVLGREDEQTEGINERALEEIDQLEQDATQGSGMWKKDAIADLKSIVRVGLDERGYTERIAERTRVTPPTQTKSEREAEALGPRVQPVRRSEPGDYWEITDEGKALAKRFPLSTTVDKQGNKKFEVTSIEGNGDVHVVYTGPATKAHTRSTGEKSGRMEAVWNVKDPQNTLTIKGETGLVKQQVPLAWRREVNRIASQQIMGYDVTVGQRMKGQVPAKVPFVGAPTIALHRQQLENRLLQEAQRDGQTIDQEARDKIRQRAAEEAEQTQENKVNELLDVQKDTDGGAVEWEDAPVYKKDADATIRTVISNNAQKRLAKGTAVVERAFQVLPDGRVRTLEIVPQGKGKRYGVFALAEGANKFVNPRTTRKTKTGKPLAQISEGIKIGEAGAVVQDMTLEMLKARGKSGTLAGGLKTVRESKARESEPAPPTAEDVKEGKEAIYEIEKRRRVQKEKQSAAQPRKRGVPKTQEELDAAAKEAAESEKEDQERAEQAGISLEELRALEEKALTEDERLFEEQQTYLGPRPEIRGIGYTAPPREAPRRLAQMFEDASEMLKLDPDTRRLIVETYSKKRAEIDKAVSILETLAETDYDEAKTARRGGFSEREKKGEDTKMDPSLLMQTGARLTLRGVRMSSQVRAAMADMLANDPKAFEQSFPEMLEEAIAYLKSDAALPLSKQEGLENEDLAELYMTAAAAQAPKSPKSKTGWTPEEVSEQAEIATTLVAEFEMSPVEAAKRAQDILYGENLKKLAAGSKVGAHGRKYAYTELSKIVTEINKMLRVKQQQGGVYFAQDAKAKGITEETVVGVPTDARTKAQVGGPITTEAAQELLERVQDGTLAKRVAKELANSFVEGELQAAWDQEAAIKKVLEDMGFGNLGPVLGQWGRTGDAQQKQLTGLWAKIDRIEQALKEPDLLRTNFNAPEQETPPPPPELSWVESIAKEYNEAHKDGRDPDLYPDQMQLDISNLKELRNPDTRTAEEKRAKPPEEEGKPVDLIKGDVSIAEQKLKAHEAAKKKAAEEAKKEKKKSPAFIGQAIEQEFGKGRTEKELGPLLKKHRKGLRSRVAGPEMELDAPIGPGYGIFVETQKAAKLRWVDVKPEMQEKGPEVQSEAQAEAYTRTVPLDEEIASKDHAATWDAAAAMSYYASVEPLKDPTSGAGRFNVLYRLKSLFTKEHGSIKGTKSAVDAAAGFIQTEHEEAMDHWAAAKAKMPGRWNNAKDAAVTHYLQGMEHESVASTTGYTIPPAAVRSLDLLKANIERLGELGVRSGAFTKPSVVAGIFSGRAYLSRSLGQTERTLGQVKKMLPELAALFEEAHPSMTMEQINEASDRRLYNTIMYHLPNMQDNLTTATFDGEAIGMKPGTKYRVQQIKVDDSPNPIPLAVVNENGRVKEYLAEDVTLRRIVRDNIKAGVTPEQEIYSIVEAMLSEKARLGVTRGRGADYGIQQARKMLRSDTEQISDAFRTLRRATGITPEGKEWLKTNLALYRTKSFDEAIAAAELNVPEVSERIQEVVAEQRLNKKIRSALNEITDPETVIAKTVDSISETIAMSRFATDMYRMLRSQGLANMGAAPSATKNWIQLMPKESSLGEASFVPNEAEIGDAVGPGVRKVHEIYVPREIAMGIREMSGYGREIEKLSGVWGGFRKLTSWSKMGKVVFNPLAHPRNLVSTGFIHLARSGTFGVNAQYANKVMLGMAWEQGKLAFGHTGRAARVGSEGTERRRLEKLMLRENLLFDGGKSGALYDLRKEGFGVVTDYTPGMHMAGRGWVKSRNFAETLFRLEDEAVKGAALITSASEYLKFTGQDPNIVKKYLKGKPLSEKEQEVFDKAIKAGAEQVKNSYPTFSRTPAIIKKLSRNPFLGAFPSFHAEMIRTTGHVIVNNVKLMGGFLPDGTRVANSQLPQAFVLGALRLSTNAALFSAAATITNLMLQAALNSDEDDLDLTRLALAAGGYGSEAQRKVRGLLAFWQRNSLTAVTDIDKENRTFTSVAVSYLSPFGQINDVMNDMVHKYKDAMEGGVDSPEMEALKAFGEGILATFGNTEPLSGSIYNRITRSVSRRISTNETKNFANWVDQTINDTLGENGGNLIGAILGGATEALTWELFPQVVYPLGKAAIEIAFNAPEDPEAEELAMEAANRAMSLAETAGHVAGFKRRHHTFDDFIDGLALDKLAFQRANTDFKFALADPNPENYYEDFKQLDARRHMEYQKLRDRIQSASEVLGVSAAAIVTETAKRRDKFGKAGDLKFAEFQLDMYSPPSPDEFWSFLKTSDRLIDMPLTEKIEAYQLYMSAYIKAMTEDRR